MTCVILISWKARAHKGGLPSCMGGANPLQTKEERRAMPMYVTYQDLVQIEYSLLPLLDCVIQSSRGKIAATTADSDGKPHLR